MPTEPRKLNVLNVVETLEMGGAENVVVNIVNRASPSILPAICCLQKSGPLARRLRPDVPVLELGKGEGNDYRLPFVLARVLRERKIDVVHSHDWGTFCECAAAALLARTPVRVHMAHGLFHGYPVKDPARALKKAVRRKVERTLARGMDRIIAVSDMVKREIVREIGIPPRKISVIRNGIDIAAPEDVERKRREAGLRPEERVLCAVGRLAAVKNYAALVEAFPEVSRRSQAPVKLLLIGDGPEREALEAQIRRLGLEDRVLLLGERMDARAWMALSHVFVLPSSYEGVSLALLEAMAAGLPAVASDVGGNPEVIIPGETGLLVRPGDVPALARAVSGLLNDDERRRDMGEAARRRAESEYNLATVVRRYEAVYFEILKGKTSASEEEAFASGIQQARDGMLSALPPAAENMKGVLLAGRKGARGLSGEDY